jgi:hypothetical protein
MKWLAMVVAVALLLAAGVYAQQPVQPGKPTLKDREKCTTDGGCVCGSPPIDVKKGCECQIDSVGKTGTQHCPIGDVGTKPLTSVLWGLVGAVIGSGLTFVAMRGRATPA